MKKFLFTFLFLILSMPVFSADNSNIFIPNLNKDQVKKAIISHSVNSNWQVKHEENYTLDIYRIMNDSATMMLYGTSYNMHPEQRIHFTMLEKKDGVLLSHATNIAINPNSGHEQLKYAPLLGFAVDEMLKDLFIGNYSYHIKYKIKKGFIYISDSPQTSYVDKNRLGSEYKKIVKINDKNINEYKKTELKELFNKCEKDQIKLEATDNANIYYLIRTYTAPLYKQYL